MSGVAGACPTLTFVVNGRTVATTASTTFSGTCADVANGTFAIVEGTAQQGSIAAPTVRIIIPSIEITGTITALAGSCSTIRMTVNGTAIAATNSTSFVGATCAQLVNGLRVSVEGTRMANGTVGAQRVVARL